MYDSTAVYASVVELRTAIGAVRAVDDALLLAELQSASRAIDQVCNRPDGFRALASPVARVYSGSGRGVQWIDECMEVTAVGAKVEPASSTYTAWIAGQWNAATGDPRRPDFNRRPFTFLTLSAPGSQGWFPSGSWGGGIPGFRPTESEMQDALPFAVPTVQVTARWGYSDDNPPVIKQACIIMAARWYKRGQSGWADSLQNGEMASIHYQREIDPDVKTLLFRARMIRPAIGAMQ